MGMKWLGVGNLSGKSQSFLKADDNLKWSVWNLLIEQLSPQSCQAARALRCMRRENKRDYWLLHELHKTSTRPAIFLTFHSFRTRYVCSFQSLASFAVYL